MLSEDVDSGEFLWNVTTFVTVLLISIAVYGSVILCGRKSNRKQAGKSNKKKQSISGDRDKWSGLADIDRDDQMEDTFEYHKPKMEEAKRAKDIKDAKAYNAGDYKTWNKLMSDDNDFEKPIEKVEKAEGVSK
ncbi:hypothetical protein GCK32_007872 [Trichostrongylus colubriformis]|uniref:Uncharacterized protein n=1 Tax=Trichostrongylus colubriformis TaxID=6319 RepID=A0AAN8GAQ0_TRICO